MVRYYKVEKFLSFDNFEKIGYRRHSKDRIVFGLFKNIKLIIK